MTALTTFLLARIAEDEDNARHVPAGRWHVEEEPRGDFSDYFVTASPPPPGTRRDDQGEPGDPVLVVTDQSLGLATFIARFSSARVLAECEAKRRIIDAAWEAEELLEVEYHLRDRTQLEAVGDYPATLRHLAQVYADHPDFDPAWAPV